MSLYLIYIISHLYYTYITLLSHLITHRTVVESTSIVGWVNTVCGNAGVDTSSFKGHSNKSVRTSKARLMGFSLGNIMKREQWSRKPT